MGQLGLFRGSLFLANIRHLPSDSPKNAATVVLGALGGVASRSELTRDTTTLHRLNDAVGMVAEAIASDRMEKIWHMLPTPSPASTAFMLSSIVDLNESRGSIATGPK